MRKIMVILAMVFIVSSSVFSNTDTNSNSNISERLQNITCPNDTVFTTSLLDCSTFVTLDNPISDCVDAPDVTFTIDGVPGVGSNVNQSFDAGVYEIVYTVIDCDGTMTCTQILKVEDKTSPQIGCLQGETVYCSINEYPPVLSYAKFISMGGTASDNCMLDTSSFNWLGDVISLISGDSTVYTRTYEIFDTTGNNKSECNYDVLVLIVDTISISCNPDIVQNTDPNVCTSYFTLPIPDIVSCDAYTLEHNSVYADNPGEDASGHYPQGETVVKWVLTNMVTGEKDSCDQMLTVNDNQAPLLKCPLDDMVVCGLSEAPPYSSYLDFFNAITSTSNPNDTILDNCAIDPSTFELVSSVLTPGFPITEIRTYKVGDFDNNFSQCQQSIIVQDMEMPVIFPPNDTTVMIIPGTCEANVVLALATATDDCTVDTLFNDLTNTTDISGNYDVGTTCVYWTAIDINGNMTFDSTCITVQDTMLPSISCPDDLIVNCNDATVPPYADLDEFLAAGGSASDMCGLDSTSFAFTELDSTNNIITREYTIMDASGNMASCTQAITIQDTINPTITCPDDQSLECLADLPAAHDNTIDFIADGGSLSDDCGIDPSTFAFVSDVSNGNKCPELITRTYEIEDIFGNSNTCSQVFTIQDMTDPTIVCSANITIDNGPDSCEAYVTIITPTAIDDNCGLVSILNNYNNTDNASDVYPVGTTVVTWTVTDSCGLTGSCDMMITVEDNEMPTITCPPTFTTQCDSEVGKHTTIPAFVAAGGTVGDNCDIDNSVWTVGMDMLVGSSFCRDTFSREYFLNDIHGNESSCTQMIIVTDTIKPTFTLPSDVVIGCNDSTDTINTGVPTNVLDNCGLDVAITFTDVMVPGSCPSNVLINRTWTFTDECLNDTSAVQLISVMDTDAPIVEVQNVEVYLDASGEVSIVPADADNGSYDECGLDVILTLDKMDFTCDDLGNSYVVLTVTDSCGNSDNSDVLVTVFDTLAPVATNPTINNEQCGIAGVGLLTSVADFLNAGGTVTDNCDAVGVTLVSEYSDNNSCPETITRMYEIFDDSNNKDTILHQVVILDTEDPVITAPADMIVSAGVDSCSVTFDFGQATGTDNCTIMNFTNDKVGNTFSVGVHEVVWTLTDGCGNSDEATQTITVEDNEAPVLIVKNDLVIDLTSNGLVTLSTAVFVAAQSDNCGLDSIAIRRMDDNCDIPANLVNGQAVTFCCSDVNTGPHNVIVSAWDIYGNMSEYMSTINIQDKLPPVINSCPSDVTIECNYPINLSDLSEFGQLVLDASLVQDIIIEGVVVGQDGIITENCPDQLTITESLVEDVECGQGAYYRTFHVVDEQGVEVTCTQSIFVVDATPFVGDSITWPEDKVIETSIGFCDPVHFDPDVFGRPSYNSDDCSQVGQTYEDEISFYPEAGCKVVRRKWKVIDWCQYESNTSSTPIGIWENVQEFLITNSVAPTITSTCNDTILCSSETTCLGNTFNLGIEAEDDCTEASALFYSFKIDLYNDGSYNFSGTGKNVNQYFKNGTHKIEWTVNDRCGNITSCDYLFTVQDCKTPSPICLHGLTANLIDGGSVELWASDFNKASSDNCTATEDLKLSFSSDVNEFGRTYTCADIGIQEVELWVTDEEGNQAFCVTYVEIQDNLEICPEGSNFVNIAGSITTAENVPMGQIDVNLSSNELNTVDVTDENGHYNFNDLPANASFKLTPDYDEDDMYGVSTLDLLLIQRHILKLHKLDDPYKLLAADVNNSGKLSGSDLIELRKLILSKIDGFTKTDSWRFVGADYQFNDPNEPWDCLEDINYYNLNNDMMASDFIAIKMGDVNNTVSDNLRGEDQSSSRSLFEIAIDNKRVASGKTMMLPVYGSQLEMSGMQLSIDLDASMVSVLNIEEGQLDIASHNFRLSDDKLLISWSNNQTISISDEPLFYIELSAKKDINTNDVIKLTQRGIRSEVYNGEYDALNISLFKKEEGLKGYELVDAVPNPFNGSSIVRLNIPQDMMINIQVRNAQGKMIYREQLEGRTGENKFDITNEKLNGANGILYYTISTNDFSQTRKMIKL